ARARPGEARAARGRGARAPRADAAPRRAPRGAPRRRGRARAPRRAGPGALAPRGAPRGIRRAPHRGLVPRPRSVPGAGREPDGAETPWPTSAALYAELEELAPSPVVRINRAVAEGRARGAAAGLALLGALESADAARGLADYQPYHAARADLLRRAGRLAEAALAYRAALDLCRGEPERRFLSRQLAALMS